MTQRQIQTVAGDVSEVILRAHSDSPACDRALAWSWAPPFLTEVISFE